MKLLKQLFVLSCLLVALTYGSTAAASYCDGVDTDVPSAVGREVDRIFNQSLDSMERPLASGGTAATWRSPAASEIAQLRCLGAQSVPFIAGHLSSERSFGRLLAVRMLGWVGGREILAPITAVLHDSDSETIKVSALETISTLPLADTVSILQTVADSDKHARVRKKAAEVLERQRTRETRN